MRRVGLSVLGVVALAAGLWAGMSSAGSTQSDGTGLKAALNVAQEVPRPKGAGSQARGTFVGTLVRKGAGGTVSWRLTFRGLTGKAMAAHVHLAAKGKPGPVALRSVWALPQRRARLGAGKCEDRPGTARGRCVRERAHGCKRGRRDPWADPEGLDRLAAIYDDRNHHDQPGANRRPTHPTAPECGADP